MPYKTYEVVTDLVRHGEQVINNIWNILEHPEFPFVTLYSTTNGVRNFPPYNVTEIDENTVRLDMAVAGYTKDRLKVELEGNILIIQGLPVSDGVSDLKEAVTGEKIRYKGISSGRFMRTFELKPKIEIESELKDGILSVWVKTQKLDEKKRLAFEIK